MKRKRPKTYEAEHAGRKVRVTVPERQEDDAPGTPERIANHPMFSPSDLAYFRRKGYSDDEILAFWDRDHAAGQKPVCVRRTGRPVRHDKSVSSLTDALRENLSPQTVAAMVAHLESVRTNDEAINRQVRWFADTLVEVVGGPEQLNRLYDELGI